MSAYDRSVSDFPETVYRRYCYIRRQTVKWSAEKVWDHKEEIAGGIVGGVKGVYHIGQDVYGAATKGSGFEKIINGYEFQVTFDESKKPSFYSDRTQFRVIMPNLNYGFDVDELDVKKDELDAKTNQSDVKVDVKDDNEVRRVGTSQKGHWEIIE